MRTGDGHYSPPASFSPSFSQFHVLAQSQEETKRGLADVKEAINVKLQAAFWDDMDLGKLRDFPGLGSAAIEKLNATASNCESSVGQCIEYVCLYRMMIY